MPEVLIGTGGWAYFLVPGDPLKAYAQVFDFVEVNSTFYSYPRPLQVRSWRSRTPPGFRFSVRCHHDLTHLFQLQPFPEAFETYDRMVGICKTLSADFLHILTPAWLEETDAMVDGFSQFFKSVDMREVKLAWEVRVPIGRKPNPKLIELIRDLGIVRCVDISREETPVESDVLYARLFGKPAGNVYRYKDGELKEISRKVDALSKQSYLSFHSVRMYSDAARFKAYRQTGDIPQLTEPKRGRIRPFT